MRSFTSASKAWTLYHTHPVTKCMEHKESNKIPMWTVNTDVMVLAITAGQQ